MSGANKGQIIEQCLNYKETAEKVGWHSRGDINLNATGQTLISGKSGTHLKRNTAIPAYTPLEVINIEGPYDEQGKIVEKIIPGVLYHYQASLNKKIRKEEAAQIKWSYQYDDRKEQMVYSGGTCKDDIIAINLRMPPYTFSDNLTVYVSNGSNQNKKNVKTPTAKVCDSIMVVGAELHEPTYGNKMRFFAQAVRTLLINKADWKGVSLIYFKQGYNSEEINAVKTSLNTKYSPSEYEMIPVTTVSELINKLNQYSKVKQLDFYSHGMPSKITFGLGHYIQNQDGAQTLSSSNYNGISRDIFDQGAIINSFACRTGNAQKDILLDDFTPYYTVQYFAGKADLSEKFTTKEAALKRYNQLKSSFSNVFLYNPSVTPADALPEKSLAQKLADYLRISVYAYITRSDYQPTWDGTFSKIDIDDESVEKGWYGLKFWHDGDSALWSTSGAVKPVKGGTTPRGLSSAHTLFKPR